MKNLSTHLYCAPYKLVLFTITITITVTITITTNISKIGPRITRREK